MTSESDCVNIRYMTLKETVKNIHVRGWYDSKRNEIVIVHPCVQYLITLTHELTHYKRRNTLTFKLAESKLAKMLGLLLITVAFFVKQLFFLFYIGAFLIVVPIFCILYEERIADKETVKTLKEKKQ
ncbi:MAG: hypothetical protein ACKD6O_08130 [Candidatus Bathyarchaeota archaeon]